MKVRIAEAEGAQLDWAVCRARHPKADMSATHVWLNSGDGEDDFLIEKTSTDWSQGGPIVERERIEVIIWQDIWSAMMRSSTQQDGPTPLIAAMRCYVASKLGDEIDIPEELCQ